jgi:hypothetical protein
MAFPVRRMGLKGTPIHLRKSCVVIQETGSDLVSHSGGAGGVCSETKDKHDCNAANEAANQRRLQ